MLSLNLIIDTVVHTELARATSTNVEGMKGFLEHFVKGLAPAKREVAVKYLMAREEAIDEFLKSAEADGWRQPEPKRKEEG